MFCMDWLCTHQDFWGFLGPFTILSFRNVYSDAARGFPSPLQETPGRRKWALEMWPVVPSTPPVDKVLIEMMHRENWYRLLNTRQEKGVNFNSLEVNILSGNDDAVCLLLAIAKKAHVLQEFISYSNPVDGRLPIHFCRTPRCVRILVHYKADVHQRDGLRRLALDWAQRGGQLEVVDELLLQMSKNRVALENPFDIKCGAICRIM